MPKKHPPDVRKWAIAKVIDGLGKGIPLTVICAEKGMPGWRTITQWRDDDPDLSAAIARARELGFDAIAAEALRIADTPCEGVRIKETADGIETVREDMLGHRKLQVETRLKLLAKWDPKRYGEMIKHAAPDGETALDTTTTVVFVNTPKRLQDGNG